MTPEVTPMAKTHPIKSCICGCSGCKGECCELECLVQPRFFCGQLLTDRDLSALLDWVKAKTSLARYRDGWGVVCGFEVDCNGESGQGAQVRVRPGYAVDCCGNDVVLCEEVLLDPSKYCPQPEDPCVDWPPRKEQQESGQIVSFGGFSVPAADVQAVDLYVRYGEKLTDPQTALARGSCKAIEACEYTRTHESPELYVKCVESCRESAGDTALAWYQEYRKGLSALLDTLGSLLDSNQQVTLERLNRWLKSYPLHDFCFIEEWLCELQRKPVQELPSGWFNEAIFWIVQDWRNHYLRCECYGCGPDAGIPLARVWLWRRKDRQGKQVWKVVYVNSYPPFRRPIRRECWPAPPGYINVGRFLWQRAEDACVELARAGLHGITMQPFTYGDFESFRAQFSEGQDPLLVQCIDQSQTGSLAIYYQPDNCGHSRIVRFGFTSPSVTAPGDDPTTLPANHPDLDLRHVNGIGDRTAEKLKAAGFQNLRDLAAATPAAVVAALRDTPINAPNEARCRLFIADAQKELDKLKKPV